MAVGGGGERELQGWVVVARCVKNDPLTYIMRLIFCGNFFTFVRVMDFKSQG